MANEVIIEEYAGLLVKDAQNKYIDKIQGDFITSQVLDIAEASAAFNASTQYIRIQSKGTGFWYILGGASPSAAANTDGNRWLPADQSIIIPLEGNTKIDTAA
jgi:hypothetical protein